MAAISVHFVPDIRSALFVPATLEERVHKAFASSADAVIVDLEDGVPESGKDDARALTAAVLPSVRRPHAVIRINGAATSHFAGDLELVRAIAPDAVVLPKADRDALKALAELEVPVWALVETATALHQVFDVAAHPRVERLLLGTLDLAADLHLDAREDGLELLYARSATVVASRAAGIAPPLDGVCVLARDVEATHRQALLSRSLGVGGKLCIHPEQLEPVHCAFAPSEEEIAKARAVLEASARAEAEGLGAVVLNGSMVDRPVVDHARRLLRRRPQADHG
jgi:citrate lyase subunit beta/citryl-CoA lyase